MEHVSYERVLNSLSCGVYILSIERKIIYWNAGAENISGYRKEEVFGSKCSDNLLRHVDLEGNPLCNGHCPLTATQQDGRQRNAEVFLHHKDGHRVLVTVHSSPYYDDNGQLAGVVELFLPPSTNCLHEQEIEKLQHQLEVDQLTGIGNRKFSTMHLSDLFHHVRKFDEQFGILFLDIDHFKRINDIHGHVIGDKVLRMVARTMVNGLRPSDMPCRWGGEEFLVLLPKAKLTTMLTVAERLRKLVQSCWIDVNGTAVSVTVSIGGTLSQANDTIETIIDRADKEVYKCKSSGRNRISIDSCGA